MMKKLHILGLFAMAGLFGVFFTGISAASYNYSYQKSYNNVYSGSTLDNNENGVADCDEDFDGDGITNRFDADYEYSELNMKDDDGDGIANKDDEDYEGGQESHYSYKYEQTKSLMEQKKSELGVMGESMEGIANKIMNAYQSMSDETKAQQLLSLQQRIGGVQEDITNSNMSETQKTLFANAFEYLNLRCEGEIDLMNLEE